jgi:hypothetical protein
MLILKVTYRVRFHQTALFEEIFRTRLMPLIADHRLQFRGLSRALVGNAGEYMELWEFASAAEFEDSWKRLMEDPRLAEIFATTGPMVEAENYALFEPVIAGSTEAQPSPLF